MRKTNPWDEIAQKYEEARPSYPDQLVQDIIYGAGLRPDDRLLEIGAGTGKATVQFAAKGFGVHCVEPGPNLTGILIGKCGGYPGVTVDVASFEEWTPRDDAKYDLVFCAQAFNWLDPEVRYRKCHELLKEGGYLAVFWYGHEAEYWESEIVASGLFQHPRFFEYESEFDSDAESQIKAMESASTFAALDEDAKSRMREDARNAGVVRVRLRYQMWLARRGITDYEL